MLINKQKQIYATLLIAFIIGTNLFFSIKAPSIHENWIRKSKVGSKTVKIVSVDNRDYGGSGFHVQAPSGNVYILTNAHVCALQKHGILNVILEGTNRTIPKRVIEVYKKHDLCLMEGIQGVSGIKVAKSISIGDPIAIVGHPNLYPLIVSKGTYIGSRSISVAYSINKAVMVPDNASKKIMHEIFKELFPENIFKSILMNLIPREAYQLHAYSRGGSSGSPIVNFYGNLVSVLFAGNRADAMDSYGVPLSSIKNFLSVY